MEHGISPHREAGLLSKDRNRFLPGIVGSGISADCDSGLAQAAAGITQDMPSVSNAMGMWVKLTTAGTLLTVGEGYEPTSTGITLSSGWNLVGYPAVDDSAYDVFDLKTDTGATMVEGYGAGPYNIVTLADNYVLQRGEAYWVYVAVGGTWTVNW